MYGQVAFLCACVVAASANSVQVRAYLTGNATMGPETNSGFIDGDLDLVLTLLSPFKQIGNMIKTGLKLAANGFNINAGIFSTGREAKKQFICSLKSMDQNISENMMDVIGNTLDTGISIGTNIAAQGIEKAAGAAQDGLDSASIVVSSVGSKFAEKFSSSAGSLLSAIGNGIFSGARALGGSSDAGASGAGEAGQSSGTGKSGAGGAGVSSGAGKSGAGGAGVSSGAGKSGAGGAGLSSGAGTSGAGAAGESSGAGSSGPGGTGESSGAGTSGPGAAGESSSAGESGAGGTGKSSGAGKSGAGGTGESFGIGGGIRAALPAGLGSLLEGISGTFNTRFPG